MNPKDGTRLRRQISKALWDEAGIKLTPAPVPPCGGKDTYWMPSPAITKSFAKSLAIELNNHILTLRWR